MLASVMGRLRTGFHDRWQAARGALIEPDLRRLNLAYLGSELAGWAYVVAISVYAFDHGGADQVGLMTVLRLAPAMLAAPFAGAVADRFPRRHVLIAVDLGRAGAQGVAAVLVMSGAPALSVYLAISASALASTGFEPAKAALLPTLARTPEQLTAANALGTTIESFGLTVGPALGGLLLALASVQVVLFALVAASLISALLIWRIGPEPERESGRAEPGGVLRRSLAGFETIGRDHTLRTVVGVFALQMLAFGLLSVFIVTIALQELHIGSSGVGWLYGATGVGGILGGLLTVNLAGRRLARPLSLGMLLIGGAFLAIGAFASEPVALLAILLMNVGGCYVDIATFTLLQRAVEEAVLARVFSVIGTIIVAALLLGGGIAPLLISALGLRGALAVTGGLVLAGIGVALPALRRIDAAAPSPLEGIALLRGLPLFATLPVPALEHLAGELGAQSAHDAEEIIVQGESGEDYYIILEGTVEVFVDGRSITTLAQGEAFGEIALLLDTPRTATVRARGEVRLARLQRYAFLAAVTGHDQTYQAGQRIAHGLLARAQPITMAF
jgi:MFS family permease